MRYLNENELARLVADREYRALVEQGFREYGQQRQVTSEPSIATITPPDAPGSMMSMKGTMSQNLRAHGVFFGVRGRDYYLAVSDLDSGVLQGVLELSLAYKKRTAASAMVAAGYFAPRDARRAAVIGSGAIAAQVVRQLPIHFRLDSITVASRTAQGARAFVETMAAHVDCPLQASDSIPAAVADADIVITITSASTPFIGAGMIKRGSFLCSLGGGHEIDYSMLAEVDRLFVDDIGYALWRGDFKGWVDGGHIARDALERRIEGHMGRVALGELPQRRGNETVMAVIQGMAISDLVIARTALTRAEREGVGTPVLTVAQVTG